MGVTIHAMSRNGSESSHSVRAVANRVTIATTSSAITAGIISRATNANNNSDSTAIRNGQICL